MWASDYNVCIVGRLSLVEAWGYKASAYIILEKRVETEIYARGGSNKGKSKKEKPFTMLINSL